VPIGLIWHIVVQRKAGQWNTSLDLPKAARMAGLVELLLWISVAAAAVLIPTVG
jgi:hypothetical protein